VQGVPEEELDDFPVGNQFEFLPIILGGGDCYKFDYSAEVRKSRCVAGIGLIA
jgi:hypothetical protein